MFIFIVPLDICLHLFICKLCGIDFDEMFIQLQACRFVSLRCTKGAVIFFGRGSKIFWGCIFDLILIYLFFWKEKYGVIKFWWPNCRDFQDDHSVFLGTYPLEGFPLPFKEKWQISTIFSISFIFTPLETHFPLSTLLHSLSLPPPPPNKT